LHDFYVTFKGVYMKKQYYFLTALMLGVFSSASLASIQNFWAYGSSDDANKSKYIKSFGNGSITKNISIGYKIEDNWTINSVHLWIKAVDDFNGKGCSGKRCRDGGSRGRDSSELARISNIEGQKGLFATKEINGNTWYDLLDVTSFLLNDTNGKFTALLKASRHDDFLFKNAKLVFDYTVISAPSTLNSEPAPLAPVPIPSAIWLFGSALLGLGLLKHKPGIAA
jgi:hypothetical protein